MKVVDNDIIVSRLQNYMATKKLSAWDIEKQSDLTRGVLFNAIKKNSGIGSDKLAKIVAGYPDINPTWLLTGEGSMLLSEREKEVSPAALYKLAVPLNHPISLERESFVLPMFHSASAGYIVGWGDISPGVYWEMQALPQHREQLVRGFCVFGDSMYPIINTGDIVFCRRVLDIHRDLFHRSNLYVVLSREGINIKYIKEEGDAILLISKNDFYEPFLVQKEDIVELWVVERLLKNMRHQ